jgi:hypothetical protein
MHGDGWLGAVDGLLIPILLCHNFDYNQLFAVLLMSLHIWLITIKALAVFASLCNLHQRETGNGGGWHHRGWGRTGAP